MIVVSDEWLIAENKRLAPTNEYRCWICLGVFTKGRPDDEAIAEHFARNPDIPADETGIVCDDCFIKTGI